MKRAKFVGLGLLGLVAASATVSVAMGSGDAPAPAPAVASAALAAGEFKVDGVHSAVVFRIKHMGVAYFYGRFDKIEGTFSVDAKDSSKNAISVSVPTDSVNSNNAGRDRHLKSQDFFSATEFPTITFKSKGWKQVGSADGETTFDVVGDMTFLGKTKEIVAQVRHTGSANVKGKEVAGLEAKFTIKRSDFGMKVDEKSLGDEVTLMVGLEGAQ